MNTASLRIAIDARPLTLPSTGIGRYTAELVSRFERSGHQLFLYSHAPFPWRCGERTRVRSGAVTHTQFASLFAQLTFPRWGRIDEIDVFFSPRHHLPLFSSAPAVVTVHDLVWRKAPESMIAYGRLLERVLMPPSLKKAQAVIAVSEATRADLLEYLPALDSRITVVPEAAFQPLEPPPAEPQRSERILFVGTFEPRKNIPGILKAFALLLDQGITSHRLQLAGNPGWKENIPALIEELGLTERVDVLGRVDQRTLEGLYAGCDFVVQPAFYEGFGLPILEAMSFGKPVITSNLSAMPEAAGDAALLVDPHSVESIAAAMKQLITDPAIYRTLAARTPAQVAKFSWDRAAEATLGVLESVARSAARR